jgi:Adenovirus IVa2 protein
VSVRNMDLSFKHPFTGICSGPTGCGKTELMKNIILNINQMMTPAPEQIIWYYAEAQPQLEAELHHLVEFIEGLPDVKEFEGNKRTLLIIDDCMSECNKDIAKLFTKGSHHRNLSVWFLMQNFFHQSKEIRTITLNAHYIILFKNPRDKQQIKVLARQMYDRSSKDMEDAFSLATSEPHGYLLVDLKQDTPDYLRMRSKILPSDRLEVFSDPKLCRGKKMEIFK